VLVENNFILKSVTDEVKGL